MTTVNSSLPLPCSMNEVDSFLAQPKAGTLETLASLEGDVIVLGAGGKMGFHLSWMLKEGFRQLGKDNTVYAASRFRTLAGREAYERVGVKTLVGDFRDAAFVRSLPECPTVFYLVGAKFGTADNPGLLQQMNVDVAAELAERYAISRIVALSTGCVYAYVPPDSGGSTEDAPRQPVGAYAFSCLGRERAFEAVSLRCGTPVTLIRLNYAVEFRYGVPVDIALKVMNGEPVDVTMGYVNIIWQNDALNQIVQALSVAASPPRPLNITGADILSVRDLACCFGTLLGRKPRFVGEEAPTAWLSDASASHRLFGPPEVSVETMMRWIAAWIQRDGSTFHKPTGFERRDGNF
ncbi:MAG: NAD dependent epimerase/dehydratase family [Puniceicoccaceae bacterium 5H]|nr:MAG: NAD dependent epimerase/dehydratase family [Puniceicoccaceae bacterium 5H]